MRTSKALNKGFAVLSALVLIIILGSIFSIKAIARDKSYFSTATDAAESDYLAQIKEVLTCNEVYKAGVTMTKTTLDGVNIDYEVSIHTSEYIYDHISDWDGLFKELDELVLEVDNACVSFSFAH